MYIIIWKYKVKPEHRDEFINYYKSSGVWVQFFQQDANFIGTDFFQGEGGYEFLTIDSWINENAYVAFKKSHKAAYADIDNACEAFTESETHLGSYTEL